jgi:ubiquinone/menaquinone biosynthesis C-methylase UbiE
VAQVDVDQVKQRTRAIWGHGDYSILSHYLEPASHALCDACAVSAGQEVLDAAAGDGNFALACAREGAAVVACDLSPGMVERGRARSRAEGFEIEWVEADVEELPFADERFDCVGSVFGAFIAPRPEVAAGELFRVTRPGGTVGMTAWTPGSFVADSGAAGRKYAPPSPDMPLPEEWGVEETARSRLEGLAASVECERRTLTWEAESVEAFMDEFAASAPPMVAARELMPPDQYEALRDDTLEVVRKHAGDGPGPVRIESVYLLTVARKRG